MDSDSNLITVDVYANYFIFEYKRATLKKITK